MSNIVSNSDTAQTFNPTGQSDAIEGVGSSAIPKYGVDPFGATQRPPTSPSATPVTPPPAQTMPDIALPSITPEVAAPTEEPPITPPHVDPAAVTSDSAATVLDRIPDVEQMMKDLEKSGCLLPDLHINKVVHVDESPLAALQPGHIPDSAQIAEPNDKPPGPVLPAIQLGTSYTPALKQPSEEMNLPLFILTAILCGFQALQGFAQATHFFMVRYPLYEQLIMDGQMTAAGMNSAAIIALGVAGLALASAVMMMILFFKQPKVASMLFYGSIGLIVASFLLQNVIARGHLASGSPLALPLIFTELFAKTPPSL